MFNKGDIIVETIRQWMIIILSAVIPVYFIICANRLKKMQGELDLD